MQEEMIYDAGLYLRLSQEDAQKGESVSIGTQRAILTDYCNEHGYRIPASPATARWQAEITMRGIPVRWVRCFPTGSTLASSPA